MDNRTPVAWMRAWAYRGETPHKERTDGGRLKWPSRFKFLAVTVVKVLPDDAPLYADPSVTHHAGG